MEVISGDVIMLEQSTLLAHVSGLERELLKRIEGTNWLLETTDITLTSNQNDLMEITKIAEMLQYHICLTRQAETKVLGKVTISLYVDEQGCKRVRRVEYAGKVIGYRGYDGEKNIVLVATETRNDLEIPPVAFVGCIYRQDKHPLPFVDKEVLESPPVYTDDWSTAVLHAVCIDLHGISCDYFNEINGIYPSNAPNDLWQEHISDILKYGLPKTYTERYQHAPNQTILRDSDPQLVTTIDTLVVQLQAAYNRQNIPEVKRLNYELLQCRKHK